MDATTDQIARALETAPAWSLIALSTRHERLRADARHEIARHVADTLHGVIESKDQLFLPL